MIEDFEFLLLDFPVLLGNLKLQGIAIERSVILGVLVQTGIGCDAPLPIENLAPRARFELATLRLTAECSTVELPGNCNGYLR